MDRARSRTIQSAASTTSPLATTVDLEDGASIQDFQHNAAMQTRTLALLLMVAVLLACAPATLLRGSEQAAADPSTLIAANQFAKWNKEHVPVTFDMLMDDALHSAPLIPKGKPIVRKIMATPGGQAMDGKQVGIYGYMIPLDMDAKGVSMFIVAPHLQTCCFGVVGQTNQLVLVVMNKKTVYSSSDPVTVFGKFHVNDVGDGGEFSAQSMYQMEGVALAVHTAAFDKAIGAAQY
jgi:hypothetical protein